MFSSKRQRERGSPAQQIDNRFELAMAGFSGPDYQLERNETKSKQMYARRCGWKWANM